MSSDFARSESFICVNKFDICQCTCRLSRQIGYSVALRGKHDLNIDRWCVNPSFHFELFHSVSFSSMMNTQLELI